MKATYQTTVIGFGKHASIEVPEAILAQLGGNRRAPLKVTVNGYTYQSTATGVDGKCMVVFPTRDRQASGARAGERIQVTLELDNGYRQVDVPASLQTALKANNLGEAFHDLIYSKRKEFARLIADAKSPETKERRLQKIIVELKAS
jgi:hypothetical protein